MDRLIPTHGFFNQKLRSEDVIVFWKVPKLETHQFGTLLPQLMPMNLFCSYLWKSPFLCHCEGMTFKSWHYVFTSLTLHSPIHHPQFTFVSSRTFSQLWLSRADVNPRLRNVEKKVTLKRPRHRRVMAVVKILQNAPAISGTAMHERVFKTLFGKNVKTQMYRAILQSHS